MMRCMVLLAGGASAAAASAPAARAAGVARLGDWLLALRDGPAPPPARWAVRGPGDLRAGAGVVLQAGGQKSVNASRLRDGRGAPARSPATRRGDPSR